MMFMTKMLDKNSDKLIAVIGGGPAGMMAAATAAELGADVTLFEKNKQLGKKIGAIGIVLTGIMAIVFGIICWCYWDSYSYYGDYVSYETYGGDAYTGIQNAAADTANNINDLISVIGYATSTLINYMGYLIFTIGVLLFVVGIAKMFSAFQKETKVIENTQNITNVQQ